MKMRIEFAYRWVQSTNILVPWFWFIRLYFFYHPNTKQSFIEWNVPILNQCSSGPIFRKFFPYRPAERPNDTFLGEKKKKNWKWLPEHSISRQRNEIWKNILIFVSSRRYLFFFHSCYCHFSPFSSSSFRWPTLIEIEVFFFIHRWKVKFSSLSRGV